MSLDPTTSRTTKLREHVSLVDTEDGAVLFDERQGTYWQLNDSGAFVVRRLLDGMSTEELTDAMTVRYPVEAERAQADIRSLLASLHQAGLVDTEEAG